MAITKTNFIEFTRCRRYSALENLSENDDISIKSHYENVKEDQSQKRKQEDR